MNRGNRALISINDLGMTEHYITFTHQHYYEKREKAQNILSKKPTLL